MPQDSTPTLVGRTPGMGGKRPKVNDQNRTCSNPGCATQLSRYNTHDLCYLHRPARFPRVRGRVR